MVVVLLFATNAFAGKGKVRISCSVEDAYVYVNGKKKAMIGEGFTNLYLKEGEYKIEVKKSINEDFLYSFSQINCFFASTT